MIKPIPGGKISILLSLLDYIQQERGLSNTQHMQMQDKNQQASEIIRNHVGFSLGAALIPMPGADL